MDMRSLPPVLAEKARLELNEDQARVPGDLQHLKEWIVKQAHLKARTDDQWLLSFLRGCKFSLEKTKAKLDLYYTLNSTAPDLTKAVKFTDPKFMEIIDLGAMILLPEGVPGEPRIGLFRAGVWDPSKYTLAEISCVANMMQKITIMEDDTAVVAGIQSICDMEGVTVTLALQATSPGLMKKMVTLSQDAAPFRFKGAHYINTPPGFEPIYNFVKNLLHEKHRNKLYVHGKNYEEMYKFLPKGILPKEYGGNGESIENITAYWKRKVVEYAEFFAQEEEFGTDERKRIGRPKTSEDMFGVDGSFRQLQID